MAATRASSVLLCPGGRDETLRGVAATYQEFLLSLSARVLSRPAFVCVSVCNYHLAHWVSDRIDYIGYRLYMCARMCDERRVTKTQCLWLTRGSDYLRLVRIRPAETDEMFLGYCSKRVESRKQLIYGLCCVQQCQT